MEIKGRTDASRMFKLLNFDEMFYNNPQAQVLNNGTLVSDKFSKEINDNIYSNADEDLNFIPTCQCGAVQGNLKEGMICDKCGTRCTSQFVDELSHDSWISIPEPMAPLMHPIWYNMLKQLTSISKSRNRSKITTTGSTSAVDIILNPEEDVPDEWIPWIRGRGFKYFYEHINEILDDFLYNCPKTKVKPLAESLIQFRKVYSDCMFSRHFPILHNSLHPKKTNGGTLNYVDKSSADIASVVIDLSAKVFTEHATQVTQRQSDKTMYNIYMGLIAYSKSLIEGKCGGKYGIVRKHAFGGRIHYSFRSVITPQADAGPLDEVILPWGIMVNGLRPIIENNLMHKHHMTPSQAIEITQRALNEHIDVVENCITEYIASRKHCGGRLPVLIGRNPTITYGSEILLYVKKFKTDPHDETIAINACVVEPMNADFDGDELYGFFIWEDKIRDALSTIHPSQIQFSNSGPGLSPLIGILKQNFICMKTFLDTDPDSTYYKEIS